MKQYLKHLGREVCLQSCDYCGNPCWYEIKEIEEDYFEGYDLVCDSCMDEEEL